VIRTGPHEDRALGFVARGALRAADRGEPRRRLRGKLNLFQTMVLRWRELHPYVAVHVVTVVHRLEAARLKETIGACLEAGGLARITLDQRSKRFEFGPGPAVIELAVLAAGDDSQVVTRTEIERQLNAPFPSEGTFTPFRFFVIDSGTSFALGIAYDHFIAGGDSIAVLLEEILVAYAADASSAATAWTPRRYPKTYRSLFLRDLGFAVRGLPRLRSMAQSCRRSMRTPCRTEMPATNGFLCFRISERELARLIAAAKAWGVTMNDLVLAMLLRALDPVVGSRSEGRPEIGVASIVNLRREFESDAHDTFGLFLASLRISHAVPAGIGLRKLAAEIHTETDRIKREKLYLQTLVALGWTALAWRFLDPTRRRRYFSKHYPIWAGVTSLNIDSLWSGRATSVAPIDYTRAVPTGTLAPLAFAITTFRGAMQIGVSHRIADVDAETARRVAERLLDQIRTFD
jgi:hypothetical protein